MIFCDVTISIDTTWTWLAKRNNVQFLAYFVRISNCILRTEARWLAIYITNCSRAARIRITKICLFNTTSNRIRWFNVARKTWTLSKSLRWSTASSIGSTRRRLAYVFRNRAASRWWITFIARKTETFHETICYSAPWVDSTRISGTSIPFWNYKRKNVWYD